MFISWFYVNQLGKTYFCLLFSPLSSIMASNIILALGLLARSIFGCHMQLEGCTWGCLMRNLGYNTSLRSQRPLIPPDGKKKLFSRFGIESVQLVFKNPCCQSLMLAWIITNHGLKVVILKAHLSILKSY